MEFLTEWHGKPPKKEEAEEAIKMLGLERSLIEEERY